MTSADDLLIMRIMSGPQEGLTKEDTDHLMEMLWLVRSGGGLSNEQRATLRTLAEKVGKARRS